MKSSQDPKPANHRVMEFIKDPKKALFTLTLPIFVAMLVQTLYNVVDTAFVGRLGAEAIAALTFSFPLFFILISLNSGIAVGMGSRISRSLGQDDKEAAQSAATHGIIISLAMSLLIFIGTFPFLGSIYRLFGAEPAVAELGISYMSIVLIGIFFMFSAFIISQIFSAQGDTKTPMIIQITALAINIILDPIFIYVLGLGVTGAAVATLISFMIALGMSIYYLRRRSQLHIRMKGFKPDYGMIKEILSVGLPASMMMLLMSFYVMIINRFTAEFSTEHVAAFGIVARLESVAVMPMVAIAMSLLTIVGMFYGAKRYDLLKDITFYTMKIAIVISSFVGLAFLIFPRFFLGIFTDDPYLIELSVPFLQLEVFTFPLMAIIMISARTMQAMGSGMPGFIINIIRIVLVGVPLAYLFVFVMGLSYVSIAAAIVAGSTVAAIAGIIWLSLSFHRLHKENGIGRADKL